MMTRSRRLAGLAVPIALAAVAVLGVAPAAPVAQEAPPPASPASEAARAAGCLLFGAQARTVTSAECRSCHVAGGSAGPLGSHHPQELEYPASSPGRRLRDRDEVLRRGVFLAEDRIRCVTCHDGDSPWAAAIALPPGSTPTRAVVPGDPGTHDSTAPPPGSRVGVKPLCLACHLLD